MKLLCFQAKRFRWKTHAKTLPEVAELSVEAEVLEAVVAFIHAESSDAAPARSLSVQRQALKHLKWLANKREFKKIVLHSFTHLGGNTAEPAYAESFIAALAERLRDAGYQVWTTPFGYFCEWDLNVYGESLAKVWKDFR
jgi:hypothetical protein